MKFLITGVSGFVGEELVYFLQKNPKYTILGIDRKHELANSKIIFKKCNIISNKDELRGKYKKSNTKTNLLFH